jgi:phosphatidylserine/phosphatidylglycerophosphate/cardiolipin synthase-like enzyme
MKKYLQVFALIACAMIINACGSNSTAATTPTTAFTLETLFTPGDKIADRIAAAIGAAQQDVKVQAYSFTNTVITNALIAAKQRGVDVQLIEDGGEYININGFTKTKVDMLKAAGISVYLDGAHTIAHNKVMVIDANGAKPMVITGSYNFTQAAENSNAENILVVSDNHTVTTSYLANWQKHIAHSTPSP